MATFPLSNPLLNDYIVMFQQLEPNDQTILLDRLDQLSAKKETPLPINPNDQYPVYYLPEPENDLTFEELAGSWEDDRSAEEIIEDLRQSRTWNWEVNL